MLALTNVFVKRMLVTALVLLSACRDSNKNSSLIFEELNESLERSIVAVENSTVTIFEAFHARLMTPAAAVKARTFEPKLNLIKKSSDEIYQYIEELKSAIKGNAEVGKVNNNSSGFENTDEIVSELFIEKKIRDSLFIRLNDFRESVLNTDSSLKKEFKDKTDVIDKSFSLPQKRKEDFSSRFFENRTTKEVYTFLTMLQTNIRIIENRLILFCYNISTVNDDSYSVEEPWIFQNSNCFRRGQELKIRATVGEIRNDLDFTLSVDGEVVPNDCNTIVSFSKRVPYEPGKYKSKVKFEYKTKYGTKEVESKIIEYEVIK